MIAEGRERAGCGAGADAACVQVSGEDFASYVSKLATPRELLIMMTEMFGRIEANPGGQLKAQDLEFAVNKAKEQAV